MKLTVSDDHADARLDVYLATERPELSRANWQKLIKEGRVQVNGSVSQASLRLINGDSVVYDLPKPQPASAQSIPILYEDENVVAINKPAGLLVHPNSKLQSESTVVDILADKLPAEGGLRPGVVHRLDRDTSGVMILAKNNETKIYLQKQFQNRTVKKTYLAVCQGVIDDPQFIIDAPLKRSPKRPGAFMVSPHGKPSQTEVKVIKTSDSMTLVELRPQTGRTHQLRVHMAYIKHPLVGDRLYGQESTRLLLHAYELTLAIAHNQLKTFTAQVPAGFEL